MNKTVMQGYRSRDNLTNCEHKKLLCVFKKKSQMLDSTYLCAASVKISGEDVKPGFAD